MLDHQAVAALPPGDVRRAGTAIAGILHSVADPQDDTVRRRADFHPVADPRLVHQCDIRTLVAVIAQVMAGDILPARTRVAIDIVLDVAGAAQGAVRRKGQEAGPARLLRGGRAGGGQQAGDQQRSRLHPTRAAAGRRNRSHSRRPQAAFDVRSVVRTDTIPAAVVWARSFSRTGGSRSSLENFASAFR